MKNRVALIIGFIFASLLPFCSSFVNAQQTPAVAYCYVPNPVQAGQLVAHAQANQDWQHAETCGGQVGDFWSDGPVYSPSPAPAGLNLTLPGNVWFVHGNRVGVAQFITPAPASTTSYWWISNATGSWTVTTSSSTPDPYSILGYTVVAGASSITSVSPAPYTQLLIPGLAIGSNQCLQMNSAGLVSGTGTACGGSPIGTPSPNATGCAFWQASWPYKLNSATDCANINVDNNFAAGQTIASYVNSTSFNYTGTSLTGCQFCGASGFQGTDVLAWSEGGIFGNTVIGSTNSTCNTVPGNGFSITNSVSGLVACWDSVGSMGLMGDVTISHSYRAYRSVVAGWGTSNTPNPTTYGDLVGSRTTSTGNMELGGTVSACDLDYGVTSTGIESFNCPTALQVLDQLAINNFGGSCANSSGTTCTATLNQAFNHTPLCFATDQSSTNRVGVTCTVSGTTVTVTNSTTTLFNSCTMVSGTTCTISVPWGMASGNVCLSTQGVAGIATACNLVTTTITVTASSSNSNTWGVTLTGIPSATGRTFQYVVIGNPN